MTIPKNISFSSAHSRLTVHCTCDDLGVVSITLNKKRGNYRWEQSSDGQRTRGPLATEADVQWYLLGLVEAGRIPMTKAKSMLHALQDAGLRSSGGGAMAATVVLSGHVDWVDGGPVIRDEEPAPYDPYDP